MGVRRTVSALAVLLAAGCGGAETEPSTEASATPAAADPAMEERLAVPQPRRPPPPKRMPGRAAGAGYARYIVAGAVEYSMRSGFSTDLRFDAISTSRGRAILHRIDEEYAQGHHIEMTPIYVEALRVERGPFQLDDSGNITHRLDPSGLFLWTVAVKYRVDELSIRDGDREIASARDLVFTDRLVVGHGNRWRVYFWEGTASDPHAPILGRPPKAAA